MKKVVMFIIFCLVIWLYTRCSSDNKVIFEIKDNRKSITFIMSFDKPDKSYFSLATEYFASNLESKTDLVTSECRTLACVINYLNGLEGGLWSNVNLVAHGNSKTGLNLYLADEGHKATPKRMVQETILKKLPRLSSEVIDSNTNINIYSCGIGTNPLISLSITRIFQSKEISPNVNCSKKYIVFRPDSRGEIQLIEANYWPYYYRRGYRPSISEIEAEMKRKYPSENNNWAELLGQSDYEMNTMDYHIPISFTKVYANKNDRPKFHSSKSKLEWVKSQPQIASQLEDLDMQYDDFYWSVDRRIVINDEGQKEYAVKAVGMSTVLCFLEM